jgi:hypothetical protein
VECCNDRLLESGMWRTELRVLSTAVHRTLGGGGGDMVDMCVILKRDIIPGSEDRHLKQLLRGLLHCLSG